MNDEHKIAIAKLVKKLGKAETRRLLVLEGVSPHTADKLIGERYPSKIGHLLGMAISKVVASAQKAS